MFAEPTEPYTTYCLDISIAKYQVYDIVAKDCIPFLK